MIDPRNEPSSPPVDTVLPSAPRDGFELGAIDVSAERPDHGLAADRSTRWLVGGLVVGSLVLAGIISLVRGGDDDDPAGGSSEVARMQVVLAGPLRSSLAALESVRAEAVTGSAVRALTETDPRAVDAAIPESAARRPSAAGSAVDDPVTPAATAKTPATAEPGAPSETPAAIDRLPPPPPSESAPEEAKPATPAEAPPPAGPESAEPRSPAPQPEAPADPAESPSGV